MRARAGAALLAVGLALAGCGRPDCAQSPSPALELGELSPPAGYRAVRVLTGLTQPTQLQFDTTGRLFVLEGGPGSPKSVRVFAPDYRESTRILIASSGESTGLLVFGSGERVLVGSRGRIDAFREVGGGLFSAAEAWIVDLPSGEHTNNGIALGPDGFVYFPVGSTCDLCDEGDPRSATVMRAAANQSAPVPEVFARGVRNPYDLAFDQAGHLIATDNGPECCGREARGCTGPGADRLLEVIAGGHYGWPNLYRGRGDQTAGAIALLPLHGGATGLAVYSDGQLPCADRGSVFVTLWGTQHGPGETGRQVVRMRLARSATGGLIASAPERFLGPAGLGHPIDLTVGPDGALYVLDFEGSVVRVSAATPSGSCP